ncbi:MAG: asparagine synthase-related protein [Nitrososphaerota archaeon]
MKTRPGIYYIDLSWRGCEEKFTEEPPSKLICSILETRLEEVTLDSRNYRCSVYASRENIIEQSSDRFFYVDCYPPDLVEVFQEISRDISVESLKQVLEDIDGFFTGFIIEKERILFFRDHVGCIPANYMLSNKSFKSSTFSRILRNSMSIPPGRIMEIFKNSFKIEKWYKTKIDRGGDVDFLKNVLVESVSRYIPEKCTVAFSGGLDSVLIAYIASRIGKNILCVSVGVEGSLDLEWSEEAAELLGLNLKKVIVNREMIEECVKHFIDFIPRISLMDLSLATLIYIVALNCVGDIVVSGQGADELFGGYYKYAKNLQEKGEKALQGIMMKDILDLHKTNIERDYVSCMLLGKRFVQPYLSRKVYDTALRTPLKQKILKSNGIVRKYVLRKVGEVLGLPEKLVWREKKAAQYSSGIQKIISKQIKTQ